MRRLLDWLCDPYVMDIKLNLIPQERKNIVCQKRRLGLILRWEMELTLIVVIFLMLLLSIRHIVKLNGEALLEGDALFEAQKGQRERVLDLQNEWREANHLMGDVSDIINDRLDWSKIFLIINQNISSGVALNQVISNGFSLSLLGKADTRESLINFKDNLNNSNCFDGVDLPFSNLVSKENIDFKIDLKIKRECLR